MWSLVSEIESYIKSLLREDPRGWIEISRKDLAQHFACVPSQITYAVSTRFTAHHGYYVESRRGGSGFIRICRLAAIHWQEGQPASDAGTEASRDRRGGQDDRTGSSPEGTMRDFQGVLYNLARQGILTEREFILLCTVFRTLEASIPGKDGDSLCFHILKELLSSGELF
jgi:transcriptional regulator CtsR